MNIHRPGQAFVFFSIVRPVRPSTICGISGHIQVEQVDQVAHGSTCMYIDVCTCNQSVTVVQRSTVVLDLEYVCLPCFFAVLYL